MEKTKEKISTNKAVLWINKHKWIIELPAYFFVLNMLARFFITSEKYIDLVFWPVIGLGFVLLILWVKILSVFFLIEGWELILKKVIANGTCCLFTFLSMFVASIFLEDMFNFRDVERYFFLAGIIIGIWHFWKVWRVQRNIILGQKKSSVY